MKRIVILCDGTWNKVDSRYPTNVVRLAQAMRNVDAIGVTQVPIYVEGVGTGKGVTTLSRWSDKYLGGMFGWGLLDNIAAAYRHLVFLYEPDDEIYIFGFSRGAYTARSLTGLIRSTGIISRDHLYLLPEAIHRYRTVGDDTTHPNSEESHRHRLKMSPMVVTSDREREWRLANQYTVTDPLGPTEPAKLTVTYLGVWDSVGALGVPRHLSVAGLVNRENISFTMPIYPAWWIQLATLSPLMSGGEPLSPPGGAIFRNSDSPSRRDLTSTRRSSCSVTTGLSEVAAM